MLLSKCIKDLARFNFPSDGYKQYKCFATSAVCRDLGFNPDEEEEKSRPKARNSYYLVQTLLPSLLLSKNLKMKIYKTIILSVVLNGCET